MAVYSGVGGILWAPTLEINIRTWSISISAGVQTGAHSTSAGWTQAIMGVKSWTATVEVYDDDTLDIAPPPYVIGASLVCQFYDLHRSFDGSAVVADVTYNCDIEGGAFSGSSISLTGNGAVVIAAAAPAPA